MARVYDTPTYENQTSSAIHNDISLAEQDAIDNGILFERVSISRFKYQPTTLDTSDAYELGVIREDFDEYNDAVLGNDEDEVNEALHERYCFTEGLKARNEEAAARRVKYGYTINAVLNLDKNLPIRADFDACFEITHKFFSGKLKSTMSSKMMSRGDSVACMARDIAKVGLAACNMGSDVTEVVDNVCKSYYELPDCHLNAIMAAEAWEKMKLSGSTKFVHDSHRNLDETYMRPSKFEVRNNYAALNLGFKKIYKVASLTFLFDSDAIYVLDYAHLEQVRAVMRTWAGYETYIHNYRLIGGSQEDRARMSKAYHELFTWLFTTMGELPEECREKLAKCMKTSLALIQNDFHDHAEKMDLNSTGRSENLKYERDTIIQLQVSWDIALLCSGANMREVNNLAYMFHLLPAPDAPPVGVYMRTVHQLNHANKADKEGFARFMKYAKASDVSKFLAKWKGRVEPVFEKGYDPKKERWYESCCEGNIMIAPERDWGKCWIEAAVVVPRLIDTWYMTAADVTRVEPDISLYEKATRKMAVDRNVANELLYTLKHAPEIAKGWTPESVFEAVIQDRMTWDKVADMSIKSENTKYGPKMRETWSADAITRELISEYDHALIPIASMYYGVTSRKSTDDVIRIFDQVCKYTVSKGYSVIASVDTSGWSPSADRNAWCEHHDYRLNMTSFNGQLKLERLLSGIHAGMSKRGFLAHHCLSDGLFQGWTGTADSILNVTTSLYCVRRGKDMGYLPKDIRAVTAGLIDDAVQAFELPDHTPVHEAQRVADLHYNTTVQTWKIISAEMNETKTIYSSIKFIYLNRFHCEGAEVLADMKTFAKVDRDYTKRLSTLTQQMDTVMGGYRASAEKGSDPVVCYVAGLMRCMDLILQTNSDFSMLSAEAFTTAAFAPRTMNGLGLPHFVAFITKERVDNLTMFTGVIAKTANLHKGERMQSNVQRVANRFLSQGLGVPSPMGTLANPYDVCVYDYGSIDGAVYRKLLAGMKKFCTSEILQETFSLIGSTTTSDAVHEMLSSLAMDAGVVCAMSEVTPESCMRAMVDKAYKADLIFGLFPFRVRSELINVIRRGNKRMISRCVNVCLDGKCSMPTITNANYVAIAVELREKYFRSAGYNIKNNTIIDPGTCIVRQFDQGAYTLSVYIHKPTSMCSDSDDKRQYKNYYDGCSKDLSRSSSRTSGIYEEIPASAKGLTAVQKAMLKLAQLSAYVSLMCTVEEGRFIWRTGCAMWNVDTNTPQKMPLFHIKAGVGAKRLGGKKFNTTHPIAFFPNTHKTVVVSAEKMAQVFDAYRTTSNFMSIVTAAKVVALICSAATKTGVVPNVVYYALSPGTFGHPALKETGLPVEIIDASSLEEYLSSVVTSGKVADGFVKAGENYVNVVDANEPGGVMSISSSVSIRNQELYRELSNYYQAEGMLAIDLAGGFSITRKTKVRESQLEFDEEQQSYGMSLQTRYNRAKNKYTATPGIAIIKATMEQLDIGVPTVLPDDFYLRKPKDYSRDLDTLIPSWKENLGKTLVAMCNVRSNDEVPMSTFRKFFPYTNTDCHKLLNCKPAQMSSIRDGIWAELFICLVLMARGKFPSQDLFQLFAAADSRNMQRQWEFAAKSNAIRASAITWVETDIRVQGDILTHELCSHIFREAACRLHSESPDTLLSASMNSAALSTLSLFAKTTQVDINKTAPKQRTDKKLRSITKKTHIMFFGMTPEESREKSGRIRFVSDLHKKFKEHGLSFRTDIVIRALNDIGADLGAYITAHVHKSTGYELVFREVPEGATLLSLPHVSGTIEIGKEDPGGVAEEEREQTKLKFARVAYAYAMMWGEDADDINRILDGLRDDELDLGGDYDESEYSLQMSAVETYLNELAQASGEINFIDEAQG